MPQYQVISSKSLRTSSNHQHQPNQIHHNQRTKRSINSHFNNNNNNNNDIPPDKDKPIKIEFEAFGEPFRLRLWPNHGLLSPGFHLINQNRESSNGSIVNADNNDWSMRKHLSNCFYQGYDEAHQNGAAAISLCSGMVSK